MGGGGAKVGVRKGRESVVDEAAAAARAAGAQAELSGSPANKVNLKNWVRSLLQRVGLYTPFLLEELVTSCGGRGEKVKLRI